MIKSSLLTTFLYLFFINFCEKDFLAKTLFVSIFVKDKISSSNEKKK